LRRRRAFALLAGAAALILQLFLAPLHLPLLHQASASPESAALAELAALTGEHNVLCADAGDEHSGIPSHDDADCPGLCCHLGQGLALFLPPPPSSPAILVSRSVDIRFVQAVSLHFGAHPRSAQPRGPPSSV
jgi:hypothetical protein